MPVNFTVVSLEPTRYTAPSAAHMSKLSKTNGGIFYEWLPESGCDAGGDAETPALLERYNEEFDPNGNGGMEV